MSLKCTVWPESSVRKKSVAACARLRSSEHFGRKSSGASTPRGANGHEKLLAKPDARADGKGIAIDDALDPGLDRARKPLAGQGITNSNAVEPTKPEEQERAVSHHDRLTRSRHKKLV